MDSTNSIFNTDVPASAAEKPENQEEKISKQVEETRFVIKDTEDQNLKQCVVNSFPSFSSSELCL